MEFLNYIYPVSYTICLFSLILWFYFRENEMLSAKFSKSFLLMFLVYAVSLGYSAGELQDKFLILFRDLVVLGVVTQFFSYLRKNAVVFFAMLLGLAGVFKVFYFEYLISSFSVNEEQQTELVNENGLDGNGEIFLEIKDNEKISEITAILDKYELKYERAFKNIGSPNDTDLDDYFVINIPDKNEKFITEIKLELLASGHVDWIEDNEVLTTEPMEAQAQSIKKEYSVNDPGIRNLWGFDKMEVEDLYELILTKKVKSKKKALIAILDTGIDSKHEDIADNYKSLNKRYDNDPQGHGTHCAGIAAAVSNNKKGVASFSPANNFLEVTAVKVLNAYGSGTQRDIIRGIIFAADQGADVISLSLGGPSNDTAQRAYSKAVKYANKKGAIVAVAAGNSSRNAQNYSPANAEGVITVTAVDKNLNKAFFSNDIVGLARGIAAPGVDIYSTFPKNQYKTFNGTSMATPYVAGLLGMMKAVQPDLDTDAAYKILKETGIDTDDTRLTGKFIQPAKVIQALK